MNNWVLKIDIKNEIQALKNFTDNFNMSYEYVGENENIYIDLAKKLESKFEEYEEKIKELDEESWDDLAGNLEDLVMSATVENSQFCMENIYSICDYVGIWLIQN